METATTTALNALRELPSRHWHGDPPYPCPHVVAPATAENVTPPYYNVILAHPPEKGTTTIRLPMDRDIALKVQHAGITIEIMLGICTDLLEINQRGPYACAEKGAALDLIRNALQVLGSFRMSTDLWRP